VAVVESVIVQMRKDMNSDFIQDVTCIQIKPKFPPLKDSVPMKRARMLINER
jgi:hypothetical protein